MNIAYRCDILGEYCLEIFLTGTISNALHMYCDCEIRFSLRLDVIIRDARFPENLHVLTVARMREPLANVRSDTIG